MRASPLGMTTGRHDEICRAARAAGWLIGLPPLRSIHGAGLQAKAWVQRTLCMVYRPSLGRPPHEDEWDIANAAE